MTNLFEPFAINSVFLTNRSIRSATWEGLADDSGQVTNKLIDLMRNLARGDVGLIITSHTFVRQDGKAGPWQMGISDKSNLSGLRKMVDAVHDENGKIVIQLSHAGCKATSTITGRNVVGPSVLEGSEPSFKQLTVNDIKSLSNSFVEAAVRAKSIGFDGVQLHAAHGYLFSQFLSPYYNRRTDEYGGTHINRSKVLSQTIRAIRHEVGGSFPILIKLNAEDTLPGGLQPSDMIETVNILKNEDIDAVEISGGCKDGKHLPARKGRINIPHGEAYYKDTAQLFKSQFNIPLILVGGIRSLETANSLIKHSLADCISMSRPFIREPKLIARWKNGDHRPSRCLSDNLCYGPIRSGIGIQCPHIENNQ